MKSTQTVLSSLTKVINLLSFVPLNLPENLQFIFLEIDQLFHPKRLEVDLIGTQGTDIFYYHDQHTVYLKGEAGKCHCGECSNTCPVLKEALPILKLTEQEAEACAQPEKEKEPVYACLPIVGGHDILGLLSLAMPKGKEIKVKDLEVLLVLTNLVGMTVQRDRLLQSIENEKQSLIEANRRLGELANNLIRAEKLATAGRIAADIAHEINNPLGIISARAECILMEQGAKLNDEVREDLQVIMKQARRVGQISRTILNVARMPQKGENKKFNVHAVVQEILILVRTTVNKKKIDLHYEELAAIPMWTVGNENHLQQVLLNLIWNAVDAMPGGGQLSLSLNRAGGKITIQVQDTGQGILPISREQIFEPFFTTKEAGHGTGLGLAISQRLIQEMGGKLTLQESKIGACFQIELLEIVQGG